MDFKYPFDKAVFLYYLANGHPATVPEIAEFWGLTQKAVRHFINDNQYSCDCVRVDRPVRSKTGGCIVRHQVVEAYQPSNKMMLKYILSLQAELDAERKHQTKETDNA